MAEPSLEERTHAPTPRRIAQARLVGHVAISRDLASALVIATACGVLVATARAGTATLVFAMREALIGATSAIDSSSISVAARTGFEVAAITLALPLCVLWLTACLAVVAQTRGLVAAKPFRPHAGRIILSLTRVLGRDKVIEAGKGMLGVGFLLAVAWWCIRPELATIVAVAGTSAAQVLCAVGVVGRRLGIHLTLAMLVLGTADYYWQHHRHEKALRMSRGEVKRELREVEGEPAHRAERLRLQRESMQEHVLSDVPRVDFVVVQSGVTAAAVRYEGGGALAPIVAIRGTHIQARAIEEAARAARVPVFVDPALAHALAAVGDGEEIPEMLYQQVAEWLVRARGLGRPSA
jgi:flagellar biosynthesis protein FlhB